MNSKIKLIACDLDGTLLDDNKNIHPSFWEIHKKLQEKGILFIAASGRQYFTLHDQFRRIEDDIVVLAENGTYVKQGNRELLVNELPLEDARFFIREGRKVPDADVILCGKSSAYAESTNKLFWEDASRYYKRMQLVDDLCRVEDTILKVTFWDHKIAEFNSYQHFKRYEDRFKVAIAGDVWLDITHLSASKGTSIQYLQKLFGITAEETMIFGDYLNDIDMMRVGWHSYAMKNAHPEILKLARFHTRFDNNQNGVVETLREVFNL